MVQERYGKVKGKVDKMETEIVTVTVQQLKDCKAGGPDALLVDFGYISSLGIHNMIVFKGGKRRIYRANIAIAYIDGVWKMMKSRVHWKNPLPFTITEPKVIEYLKKELLKTKLKSL